MTQQYKYVLKDKYKKLLEIYPHLEHNINSKYGDEMEPTGGFISVANGLTHYLDDVWVCDGMLDKKPKKRVFKIKDEACISLTSFKVFEEFQKACEDQFDDESEIVFVWFENGNDVSIRKEFITVEYDG